MVFPYLSIAIFLPQLEFRYNQTAVQVHLFYENGDSLVELSDFLIRVIGKIIGTFFQVKNFSCFQAGWNYLRSIERIAP